MPYRRLPNTDVSRIKALNVAIKKASSSDFQDVAVSMKSLSEAKVVLEIFQQLCAKYQQSFDTQVKVNIVFQTKVRNARMYISHFVQVLYMSILRLEIKEEYLELYGLQNAKMQVPDLSTNDQILEWGEKIIIGESRRIAQNGVPIYNPTIAKVKVIYSLFKDGYKTQQLHQKSTARMLNDVAKYRADVDNIIYDIWQEVESFYSNLPANERLERNKEYGLIYYYRKGEEAID